MKKALKIIGRIILVLLILLAIAVLICFIHKTSARKKDRELLEKDGFCNLVSAGDFQMNVNIFGNGKHKIIAMPGSGDAEFTVDMKLLSEHLRGDVSLVAVTRPGYGLCEESEHEITAEYIVESTRTALKNAGISAPYILMPHSLSGIYGTYWENTYPDEIEGVIFLDSINEASERIPDEELAEMDLPFITKLLNAAGVLRTIEDITGAQNDDSEEKYQADYAAFDGVNPAGFSPSFRSEILNYNRNSDTAWASIKANSIPKIYISTDYASLEDAKEYVRWSNDGTPDDAKAQERYDDQQAPEQIEYRQKRAEYITKLGNCKEVNIPGSHFIYYQKPEEVAKAILQFIDDSVK